MRGYSLSIPPDPYEALGLDKSAPLAAIRSAHRKLVLACHPDNDSSIAAANKFSQVQQAYELLSDKSRRARYDRLREGYDRLDRLPARIRNLISKEKEERKEIYESPLTHATANQMYDVFSLGCIFSEAVRLVSNFNHYIADTQSRLLSTRQKYRHRDRTIQPPRRAAPIKASSSSLVRRLLEAKDRPEESGTKLKQGLAGFANNSPLSAVADTGSQKNVISASYAEKLGLRIENLPSSFTLGNSRRLKSIGTVSLRWSFAESPGEAVSIICDVLPRCIYDLILGNGFLTATETMSRFRHRLTQCQFPVSSKNATFAYLGETCQRLEGVLAGKHNVLAVPDSGAERNVMDLQYAVDHGFRIKKESENRNWLQFADGSYEETIGQVDTCWEFATGEQIPVTFEILENCCSDVVIGEEVLTRHNVFDSHASSLISWEASPDSYELAPFDFISRWQQHLGSKRGGAPKNDQNHTPNPHNEERRRRDIWNFEHKHGADATNIEKELEKARRALYDKGGTAARMPMIPSIPTAPSGR